MFEETLSSVGVTGAELPKKSSIGVMKGTEVPRAEMIAEGESEAAGTMTAEKTGDTVGEANGNDVECTASPKVELVKIGADASIGDAMKAYEFCRNLFEYSTNGFCWPVGLINAPNVGEFQKRLEELNDKEELNLERLQQGCVPQETWWVQNENNAIIGIVKLRYLLTPEMLRKGGHVAYGLSPENRGKGYGTATLKAALEKCREHGLKEALVTTYDHNWPSRRVIEKCYGELWDFVENDDGLKHARYWISC